MAILFLSEDLAAVSSDFRVQIPKRAREELALEEGTSCVFAGRSEDCVGLWALETWNREIQPRIDAILGRDGPVVRIEQFLSVFPLIDRLHRDAVREKGRIRLPPQFEGIVEPTQHRKKLRNAVAIVHCGLCVEIWRPSAWEALQKQQWPRFWEAIDGVAPPGPLGD